MAKKDDEQVELKRGSCQFTLVGAFNVDGRTFSLDQHAKDSSYIYSRMNSRIDCGEKFGNVYLNIIGGFDSARDNVIYVCGKKDNGQNDWTNRFTVDWADRTNPDVCEQIGNQCFLTAGIERDVKGKIAYQNFLSEYDFIAYLNKTLKNGTRVKIKGEIEYNLYKGNVSPQLKPTYIALVDDEVENLAEFRQTLLLDKNSVGKIDKETMRLPVTANVVQYVNKINKVEVKRNIPLEYEFKFQLGEDMKKNKMIVTKILSVEKDVTEATFIGNFVGGGGRVLPTVEDLPEDIQNLISVGLYSEEEAIQACAQNSSGGRTQMVLTKPYIRRVQDENNVIIPTIDIHPRAYTEDEIEKSKFVPEDEREEIPFEEVIESEEESGDDTSWLKDFM